MLIYAYISKELYNEVLERGRVYPILGHSCNNICPLMYEAYNKKFGKNAFFAWSENVDTFENDEEKEVVYVELEVPNEIVVETNTLNYSDLLCIYSALGKLECTQEELFKVLVQWAFFPTLPFTKTLDDFWDDVFKLEPGEPSQILYDYIDKSFIRRVCYKKEAVITYKAIDNYFILNKK